MVLMLIGTVAPHLVSSTSAIFCQSPVIFNLTIGSPLAQHKWPQTGLPGPSSWTHVSFVVYLILLFSSCGTLTCAFHFILTFKQQRVSPDDPLIDYFLHQNTASICCCSAALHWPDHQGSDSACRAGSGHVFHLEKTWTSSQR